MYLRWRWRGFSGNRKCLATRPDQSTTLVIQGTTYGYSSPSAAPPAGPLEPIDLHRRHTSFAWEVARCADDIDTLSRTRICRSTPGSRVTETYRRTRPIARTCQRGRSELPERAQPAQNKERAAGAQDACWICSAKRDEERRQRARHAGWVMPSVHTRYTRPDGQGYAHHERQHAGRADGDLTTLWRRTCRRPWARPRRKGLRPDPN